MNDSDELGIWRVSKYDNGKWVGTLVIAKNQYDALDAAGRVSHVLYQVTKVGKISEIINLSTYFKTVKNESPISDYMQRLYYLVWETFYPKVSNAEWEKFAKKLRKIQ